MTKFTADEINRAMCALRQVDGIDETIRRLATREAAQLTEYGSALRAAIGRNLLSQCASLDIGRIAVRAIVADLLRSRAELVAAHGDWVTFPDPPHLPTPFTQSPEEAPAHV